MVKYEASMQLAQSVGDAFAMLALDSTRYGETVHFVVAS